MELEYRGKKVDVELWRDGLHIWVRAPSTGLEYVNYIDLMDYMIKKDEDFKILKFKPGEKQIIISGIFEQ